MRRVFLLGVTLLTSVTLPVVAAEVLLRATGRTPVLFPAVALPHAAIHEPDPVLGWRNKPGAFVWPGFKKENDIRLTFWEGGRRATAPVDRDGRSVVVILGCSFTQGWAISDDETYPWKLQEQFPELHIVNLGTAGYGTYQSLLALERYLTETADTPRLVIYGFGDFHEMRNVASGTWLRSVTETSDVTGVKVPFASLGRDGTLLRHPPGAPLAWPLRDHLASVAFLEARYTDFRTRHRTRAQREVTEALLVELDRRVRDRGTRLLVPVLAGLQPGTSRQYIAFMERQGIAVADCQHPKFFDPQMKVPGYGHPNARLNAYWATCIGGEMRRMALPESAERTPSQ